MVKTYAVVLRSYLRPAVIGALLGGAALIAFDCYLPPALHSAQATATATAGSDDFRRAITMVQFHCMLFAGAIGWHSKQQIANSRAMSVPNFRPAHFHVALVALAALAGAQVYGLCRLGAGGYSAAAYVAVYMAACLWASHVDLSLLSLVFGTRAALTVFGGLDEWLATALRAGPGFGSTLLLVGAVATIRAWALRLIHLNPECYEWQRLREREAMTESGSHLCDRARARKDVIPSDWASRQFAKLTGYIGSDVWQRARLWKLRAGSDPPWIGGAAVGLMFLLSLCIRPPADVADGLGPILFGTIAFPMAFACATKPLRQHAMVAWEWLRPTSRPQFFREVGLAGALAALEFSAALAIGTATLGAVLSAKLRGLSGAALLVTYAGSMTMLLGLAAWCSQFRSEIPAILVRGLAYAFGFGVGFTFLFLPAVVGWIALWLGGSIAMSVIGVALARAAYRAWCKRGELG